MLYLFRVRYTALLLFSWATLFASSRIYLGVNYPLDILGGLLVGLFSATLVFLIAKYCVKRYPILSLQPLQRKDAALLAGMMVLNLLALFFYAWF